MLQLVIKEDCWGKWRLEAREQQRQDSPSGRAGKGAGATCKCGAGRGRGRLFLSGLSPQPDSSTFWQLLKGSEVQKGPRGQLSGRAYNPVCTPLGPGGGGPGRSCIIWEDGLCHLISPENHVDWVVLPILSQGVTSGRQGVRSPNNAAAQRWAGD